MQSNYEEAMLETDEEREILSDTNGLKHPIRKLKAYERFKMAERKERIIIGEKITFGQRIKMIKEEFKNFQKHIKAKHRKVRVNRKHAKGHTDKQAKPNEQIQKQNAKRESFLNDLHNTGSINVQGNKQVEGKERINKSKKSTR